MDRKWTPGPWYAEIQPVFGHVYIRQDPQDWKGMGYQWIADCHDTNNAHLIAASPDLYEVLSSCVAALEKDAKDMATAFGVTEWRKTAPHTAEITDLARSALAKARGEA